MDRRLSIVWFSVCLLTTSLPGQEKGNGEKTEMMELEKNIRLLLQLPLEEDSHGEESTVVSGNAVDPETQEEARTLLKKFREEMFPEYRWFYHKSANLALGYQWNVLKEPDSSIDSSYLSGNLEASASLIRNRSPRINLYAVAERREYLDDVDLPPEDLLLLFNGLSVGKDPSSLLHVETTAFYLRQVMEDPLQQGAPLLLTLWNFRTRAGVLFDWSRHSLFTGFVYSREWYEDENFDYTSGGFFLQWLWEIDETLTLVSKAEYAPRSYDERLAREANGIPIDDLLLRLDHATLTTGLEWEPAVEWIEQCSTTVSLKGEWSDESDYDTNVFTQVTQMVEFSFWDFRIVPSLKGSYRRYRDRQVSFSDQEIQEQWRWGAVFTVKYLMGDALHLEARYMYDYSNSNRDTLDYASDSVQISAGYTF